MKYLIILITLSGCTVEYHKINNASINCKDHGGIDYLRIFPTNGAVCNDGTLVPTNKKGKV